MGKRVSYPALDRMKYAAAIMVIMIHCDTLIPQAETNFFIKNIICRIAVPFFFVSSSFFIRKGMQMRPEYLKAVSYTHLRAHETGRNLVCRLLLEKKKKKTKYREEDHNK